MGGANEGLMLRRVLNMAGETQGRLVFNYVHRCGGSYRPLTVIVLEVHNGEKRVNFMSHWPEGGRVRTFSGSHGSWSLHSNHSPAMLELKFSWSGIFGRDLRTLRMTYIKGGAPDGTDMWEGSLGVEVWNTVSIYENVELQMHEVRMWLGPSSDVSMPDVQDWRTAGPQLALEDIASVPSCDEHAEDTSWEVLSEDGSYWM